MSEEANEEEADNEATKATEATRATEAKKDARKTLAANVAWSKPEKVQKKA